VATNHRNEFTIESPAQQSDLDPIANFPWRQAEHEMTNRSSRIGLSLFAFYLVFYLGFVLLAVFAPQTMEITPLAGVNLAIWYGFALILVAIVLAFIYGWACRPAERESSGATDRPRSEP
jgi:uncharacterized membrane protein (DUF485 family)